MAVQEQTFLASPFAGPRGVIIAPFQFETTLDDNLQVVSANSLPGVVLAIHGRRRTATGAIEPFAFTHTPTSDRTTKTENFALGAGALLNLTIFASSGSPKIGQTYVSVRLIRGFAAATVVLGGLLGGYVTASQPLAYPGSPITHSLEPQWIARTIQGTNPAAGVEIAEILPTGARWDLLAVTFELVADATVATRNPVLQIEMTSPTPPLSIYGAGVQTAGLTTQYTFAQGLLFPPAPSSAFTFAPLPSPLLLVTGGDFKTLTANLQAGDNYGAPIYVVREWLEA